MPFLKVVAKADDASPRHPRSPRSIRPAAMYRPRPNATFRDQPLIYAWTLDSLISVGKAIKAGANGMITHYPSRLLKVVERNGIERSVVRGWGFLFRSPDVRLG